MVMSGRSWVKCVSMVSTLIKLLRQTGNKHFEGNIAGKAAGLHALIDLEQYTKNGDKLRQIETLGLISQFLSHKRWQVQFLRHVIGLSAFVQHLTHLD